MFPAFCGSKAFYLDSNMSPNKCCQLKKIPEATFYFYLSVGTMLPAHCVFSNPFVNFSVFFRMTFFLNFFQRLLLPLFFRTGFIVLKSEGNVLLVTDFLFKKSCHKLLLKYFNFTLNWICFLCHFQDCRIHIERRSCYELKIHCWICFFFLWFSNRLSVGIVKILTFSLFFLLLYLWTL